MNVSVLPVPPFSHKLCYFYCVILDNPEMIRDTNVSLQQNLYVKITWETLKY